LPYTDTPKDKDKEIAIIKKRTTEFQKEIPNLQLDILVIHSDRRLEENETHLIGDDYEAKTVSISNDYLKIFDTLTSDVLSPSEIEIFKNKKNAEREFNNGMLEEDLAKKIQHFTKAIELDKTKYRYYLERGRVYHNLKDFENTNADLENALSLNPDSIEILNSIAWHYGFQDKFTQALEYIEKSIQLNKLNWWSLYIKSLILIRMSEYLPAIKILDYIIEELKIEIADVFNTRADALRVIKNYERAYQDIYKAIEIKPEHSVYFGTLAEIYACEGKINEFYLNLNIALSKGITAKAMQFAKDVYEKFRYDEKFIALMDKYSIDLNELFSE
jgi:tetratricopeptide (TPR) repeat protein